MIRFLEDDGEILDFLRPVYQLADHHVERYMQRGFTSLMFCFGCTGGQHRSVYSAQHLAEHIHEKYGIEVRVTHREQHIQRVMEAKDTAKGRNKGLLLTTRPRFSLTTTRYMTKQAMIFAAGLGTRLKPLTDRMPKALVPVAGEPLLAHVIRKLKAEGFTRIVVNVHHFADQIIDYLHTHDFGWRYISLMRPPNSSTQVAAFVMLPIGLRPTALC